MPETFRLIKDRLYRDSFQSWHAYQLAPVDGILRLYAPAGTHLFDSSGWSEAPYSWQTLILPDESFVPHLWRRPDGGYGLYIDIARRVLIRPEFALWEDIHLDVLVADGMVTEKDAEMLDTVPPHEASHARTVRDEVRVRIASGDPIFQPSSELWSPPDGMDAPLPRRAELSARPSD